MVSCPHSESFPEFFRPWLQVVPTCLRVLKSDAFSHDEIGSGAKRRVILRRENFYSYFSAE